MIGTIECEHRTYETEDLPNKKNLLCKLGIHRFSKEEGGMGIWAYFPSQTIVQGDHGNAGCYYKICKLCGKVKMLGIHFGY